MEVLTNKKSGKPRRNQPSDLCKHCNKNTVYVRKDGYAYSICRVCSKKSARLYKYQVIKHYSKGLFCCAHCHCNTYFALTIDHINNNGAQHRKEIGRRSGGALYIDIIKNNFPEGYQILCFNCNYLKEFYRKAEYQQEKDFLEHLTSSEPSLFAPFLD